MVVWRTRKIVHVGGIDLGSVGVLSGGIRFLVSLGAKKSLNCHVYSGIGEP